MTQKQTFRVLFTLPSFGHSFRLLFDVRAHGFLARTGVPTDKLRAVRSALIVA
jgi:hypothetical protein